MSLTSVPSNSDAPGKPIRLLLVAPSLRILGGQAVQASYLLEHLSRESQFEVSFVAHNPRLPRPFRFLQRIKYVRTIVTSLLYGINLLLTVPRYDIIHVFSASYFSFLLAPTPAIFLARLFGKKVILNYHSGEAEDHLRCWPRTSVPIMKLADALVVPSQYLVDVFGKFGLHAHAVANVIDQQRFRFHNRRPLLPIFLSNRNLYPLYNVACILRAFARIQARFPEARLIIAGDGKQRPSLEQLARELELQNVEFRGLVTPDTMGELYDQSHIFLNSSNIDNMPGSILESFACGMPVVSTNAGGIRFLITHEKTGLLVPKNDHEAMASWAIRLLESPELAESIVRNSHEECAAYTWPAVRASWLELYRQLVGLEPSTAPATGVVSPSHMMHSGSLEGAAEES
jgi:glycosyltransferase involved in cell wall biosynthesis